MRDLMLEMSRIAHPHEAWGLVIDRETAYALQNIADDPAEGFAGDPVEVAQVLDQHHGEFIGVWHSHPGGRVEPSNVDWAMQPEGKLMFIVAGGEIHEYDELDRPAD